MNGYAVHKDCSEGYPKEKGATKTGFSHLNKRMETGMGVEVEVGIETVSCNSGKWEVKAQLLSYIFVRRQGSTLNAGHNFPHLCDIFLCFSCKKKKKRILVSDIHSTSTIRRKKKKKKLVAAGSIVKEMARSRFNK